MVRGAVLALVVFIGFGCSGGQSGSVTLAPTAGASPPSAAARATVAATPGRTATVQASPTPRPSAAPTTVSSVATPGWYTSSAGNAKYYYCDADRVEIAAKNRRAYPTEQALLAEWSGKRTKWPQSKC